MPSNHHLTPDAVLRAARGQSPLFDVDTSAMSRSHDFVVDAVSDLPVYGRSTGVGANKSVDLHESNSIDQDLRLLRSHAVGAGDLVDDETVRIAMIIRLNQLLHGGSGISPDVVPAMRAFIESGARPRIHSVGSLGTGDLSQLAELALTLLGEAPTRDGETYAHWLPHGGDALPFLSGNAFTVAAALTASAEIDTYLDHVVLTSVASMRLVGAAAEPFAEAVQTARPQPGQHEAAAAIRAAIGERRWQPRRLQDSFGFRALTPVLATLLTARNRLVAAIEVEINSSVENPHIASASREVLHNGNFHTQQLMLDLEAAILALLGAAQLSAARTMRLSDPEITGLEPFLSDDTPGSSGAMMVEYITASALGSLRLHAQPASLSTTIVARGTEDHAPLTAHAAHHLLAGLTQARRILAVELLMAGRGLALTEPGSSRGPEPATASAPFLDYIDRAPLDPALADRPLTDDITRLEEFVATAFEGPASDLLDITLRNDAKDIAP